MVGTCRSIVFEKVARSVVFLDARWRVALRCLLSSESASPFLEGANAPPIFEQAKRPPRGHVFCFLIRDDSLSALAVVVDGLWPWAHPRETNVSGTWRQRSSRTASMTGDKSISGP